MKPNILYLILDSFKPDKCFGINKTSKTPNIDSLIENGVYLSQVISCSDATASSLGSMFTGLYPFKTGIGESSKSKLNSKITNFLTLLKNYGYHSYCIAPKLGSYYGIMAHFENRVVEFSYFERLPTGLGHKILKSLGDNKLKKPWFYFIHLFDSHIPISYPDEFSDKQYGDNNYDRMISSIDIWIGKILKKIPLDKTLVILTSDHGEYIPIIKSDEKNISFESSKLQKIIYRLSGLVPDRFDSLERRISLRLRSVRNRQKLTKLNEMNVSSSEKRTLLNDRSDPDAYLFDETIRIPLIFSFYGVPSGKFIQQQIRSVDIFPTIAQIIEMPFTEREFHGRSLLPLFNGDDMDELPAYIESDASLIEKPNGKVIGIRTSKFKYFRSKDDPTKKINLYYLKNDPHEENNLADIKPELVKDMEKTLSDLIKDKAPLEKGEEMSQEDYERVEKELAKLGYRKPSEYFSE